jgi:Holliday junction resolvase RusA-like endonuclease
MKLNITPMAAPRMTQKTYWKHKNYFKYKDDLRKVMGVYELGLSLNIVFYIPMPKSWSKKKRAEMVGTYHDQKPDIDNLAKGFMDAFGSDDKHVAVLHAEKFWAEEGAIEVL